MTISDWIELLAEELTLFDYLGLTFVFLATISLAIGIYLAIGNK